MNFVSTVIVLQAKQILLQTYQDICLLSTTITTHTNCVDKDGTLFYL